jgi:membrane associated rhomboid family serine protease
LSVNTWLIIINVAVFLLGHLALPIIQRSLPPGGVADLLTWRTPAGTFYAASATEAQRSRGVVDRSQIKQMLNMPGYLYHPIYDPQSVVTDAQGRVLLNLRTGQPAPAEIGGQRFMPQPILTALGHFSTGKSFLELQVWRFVTFQFLHVDVIHLLFNMLGLWFVGWVVEEYLGRRRYLAFYLACGIFGAIGYLVLNFLGAIVFPGRAADLPALLVGDVYTPLVGASAGVFGVLMAAAFIAPTAIVDVLLIIPMKMRTAVYLFLGLATLNLLRGGINAGGDAAHVGGALAGAYFIRNIHVLRDFFDVLGDSRRRAQAEARRIDTGEVDRVLDKVKAQGLASLTPEERAILKAATTRP